MDINDPEMNNDDAGYKPPQQWGISTFKPPPVLTKSPPAKNFLGPSLSVESDWGDSTDLEPTSRGQKALSARSGKSNHWGESDDDDDDIPTIPTLGEDDQEKAENVSKLASEAQGKEDMQPEDDDKWDSESDIASTPQASNDDLLQQKTHVPSPLAAVDAPAAAHNGDWDSDIESELLPDGNQPTQAEAAGLSSDIQDIKESSSDESTSHAKHDSDTKKESVQIPPRSVTVRVLVDGRLQQNSVVQLTLHPDLLAKDVVVPTALMSPSSGILLPLANFGDRPVCVVLGCLLGVAAEIDGGWRVERCDSGGTEIGNLFDSVRGVGVNKNASDIKNDIPERLQSLWERSVEGLEAEQTLVAAELLLEFTDIFAENDLELGCSEAMEHGIDTWGALPVIPQIRRTPSGFENEEKQHLQKILTAGVIKPNQTSAWASASVLVKKEDGGVCQGVDFLAVNQVARRDFCSLPLVESCIGALAGVEFVGTLGLWSGCWRIGLDPEDVGRTAFIAGCGLFGHIRMPFGLCGDPAVFRRAIELVLRGLPWDQVMAYLDNVIVVGVAKTAWL